MRLKKSQETEKTLSQRIEDAKEYYMREDITNSLFAVSEHREISPIFNATYHGKRPNIIQFPGDISYFAKNGATSFHSSVELWKNPLSLSNSMKPSDMDKLRIGWDFILDMDSKYGMEYAKKTAIILVDALKNDFDVNNISIKFSGSRGFHLGMTYRMLPDSVDMVPTRKLYPDLPRKIASYLREFTKNRLTKEFLKLDKRFEQKRETDNEEKTEREKSEESGLVYNPFQVVDVEQNWGSRHLFRMPYSLNEKTWLASKPISQAQIQDFKMNDARMSKIKGDKGFLDKGDEGEMNLLVTVVNEWSSQIEEKKDKEEAGMKKTIFENPTEAISKEYFPPCITSILNGIHDGRKRSVFILINFMRSCGWGFEAIKYELAKWNKLNPDALPNVYISTQLNYAISREKIILPPNCENNGYYKDMTVCEPDGFCRRIRNPAQYAIKKEKNITEVNKAKKKPKTEKHN
ncbi:MAG: hypothetical protein K0B02_01590 [DPANN group archaeon]|nr:hypothetical protein [DPANN group archaeon]